jgi:archaellum biogenesis ATPase FlaH
MSYFKSVKKLEKAFVNDVVNKETVEDIKLYPFVENLQRGITKETCMKFGVRAALSEKDGKTPTAYYFPSYNQKGEIIGYTKQDVTKNKDEKWHWSAVGTVAIGNKLFGQNVAEQVNRKHTNFTVTEGQWDCLSVFQAQCDSVKGTKYEGHQPFVVSIPLGTKNSVESMLHNKDFVKSFQSMTIFFDDDEATPLELKKGVMKGKEAREAVAAAFIGGIELWSVQPTNGKKDASDYMQAGLSGELAKLVQFGRKPLVTEKIVKANVLSLEDIIKKREEGIYINAFPNLMEKIHGFRKRELVLLTAPSGTGKSTLTSIFADAFVDHGEKVGMIFLEEEIKDTVQRLIASRLKVSYIKFKSDPLSCASQEQIQEAYEYIVNQDRVVLLDHFGSLPVSELMAKIKHMHFVEGCSYILLDHLSMVISGSQVADERKELDMVMTELAAFCAANDVCIIAVSHINRTGADQFKPPKGKENESYWVRITKEMLRGSAALEQLSWTILGLEPEILPDRSRGNVRLTVLKNRTWGFLGEADEFSIDQNTWEVVLADKPKQPIQIQQGKESVTIKPKCLDDDPELGF